MLRVRAVFMAGALAAGGGLAGTVSVAASTVLSGCDSAITAPGTYVLGADLDCSASSSDGVDIESSNVTLNLEGYAIEGGTGANGYDGVFVYSGGELKNVTVENGTIEDWETDVFVSGASNFTASKLTLAVDGTNDYDGFEGESIDKGSVSAVDVSGSAADGFELYDNASLKVGDSTADNGEYGFVGEYNDADTYLSDTANGNAEAGFDEMYSDATTFSKNQADGNYAVGIDADCDDAGAVTAEGNSAYYNGDGIVLDECIGYTKTAYINSLIKFNSAIDNVADGFDDTDSFGASWLENVAKYNGGYGMNLIYPGDDTVAWNVTSHNATGIYLEENYSSGDVDSASYNEAFYNDDYGLYADAAAPGSHNDALDNTPFDCFNFVCISNSTMAKAPAASMPRGRRASGAAG